MSPKKITRLALIVAAVSIMGMIVMAVVGPEWGLLNWWPAMGLGLAGAVANGFFSTGSVSDCSETSRNLDLLNDSLRACARVKREAMGRCAMEGEARIGER